LAQGLQLGQLSWKSNTCTRSRAMSSHILTLPSGGTLDLNQLPNQEWVCRDRSGQVMEMLQVCRDRIFALESQAGAAAPITPSKVNKVVRTPASSSKAVAPAQVTKEKKSIVKEIKKRITALKFHQAWDKVAREVKFAADRISPEAAEQLLGMSRASWSSATVHVGLGSNFPNEQSIENALAISPGDLTGSVWRKGGAMRGGHCFGSVKAQRLGNAALSCQSLKLSYNVKSQRLTGSLVCVNDSTVTSNKRRRGYAYGDGFTGCPMDSEDDEY